MDILIGLVIAMFVITAAYVGYYASQEPIEYTEGHHIDIELKTFDENSKLVQTLQKYDFSKSII
ncbi:MAG: hypothetical protein ACRBB5_07540 [Nitrosopumilus sp.]